MFGIPSTLLGDSNLLSQPPQSPPPAILRNVRARLPSELQHPEQPSLWLRDATLVATTTTQQQQEAADDSVVLDWHPHLDFIDNEAQLRVLVHHYQSEFGVHHHNNKNSGPVIAASARVPPSISTSDIAYPRDENEMLKDYHDDSVIYAVVDDQPVTFRGLEGARQSLHQFASLLLHHPVTVKEDPIHLDLQHISVKNNHAQVIWKAENQNMAVLGTDSFTFDQADNHIVQQTVVALTEQKQH